MSSPSPEDEAEALQRLLRFLLGSESSDTDAESQLFSDWLKATEAVLHSNPDPLQIRRVRYSRAEGVVTRLVAMLRDCMLALRHKESTKVLMAIVERASKERLGTAVLHIGLELLFHSKDSSSNDRWLKTFTSSLKSYSDLREHQVCVAEFLHEASRGRFDEARQALELNRMRAKSEYNVSAKAKQRKSATFHKAYRGLISYINWLLVKTNLEIESETGESFRGVNSDAKEQLMTSLARSAMEDFEELMKEPGTWDIFVAKYIELLEYLGDISTAQTVLREYAAVNPENPNAWKYLYHFYNRHGDVGLAIQALQEIVSLIPSDELVLDLYELSKSGRLNPESTGYDRFELLFDLLDYSNWFDSERPWKLLGEELVTRVEAGDMEREECEAGVKNCWSLRADWWPSYHFSYPPICCAIKSSCSEMSGGKVNDFSSNCTTKSSGRGILVDARKSNSTTKSSDKEGINCEYNSNNNRLTCDYLIEEDVRDGWESNPQSPNQHASVLLTEQSNRDSIVSKVNQPTSIEPVFVYKAIIAHFLLGRTNSFTGAIKEIDRRKTDCRLLLHRARKLQPFNLGSDISEVEES